jgi:hypothetical protein
MDVYTLVPTLRVGTQFRDAPASENRQFLLI